MSTNVFPISGEERREEGGERLFPGSRQTKSTDARLLDITEAEASVGSWTAVSDLVRVQVNPDGEGSDEAVYGAVGGVRPVGRVVGH